MGQLGEAAMRARAEKQREEQEHRARLEAGRRRDEERDALIGEFIDLMQAKGIAPDVMYLETVRHPPRYSGRSDIWASYEPANVCGWVVTREGPGEYDMCAARGLLLTAEGDVWKYEASHPHPAYTGPGLTRSAYFRVYHYNGHGSILHFINQSGERYMIQERDLIDSAATYLASLDN